jgi:hypothetical protein
VQRQQPRGSAPWPSLTQLSGELVFERDRAVPHAGLYGDAQVFRGWVCLAGTPSNEACDPGEVA